MKPRHKTQVNFELGTKPTIFFFQLHCIKIICIACYLFYWHN